MDAWRELRNHGLVVADGSLFQDFRRNLPVKFAYHYVMLVQQNINRPGYLVELRFDLVHFLVSFIQLRANQLVLELSPLLLEKSPLMVQFRLDLLSDHLVDEIGVLGDVLEFSVTSYELATRIEHPVAFVYLAQ